MDVRKVRKRDFHIIRVAGELTQARTPEGYLVSRSEQIFFPEYRRFVKCAPYDNQFVFEDRKHIGWALFCTCGSPAVIVGYSVYRNDASPTTGSGIAPGELLVCLHHAQYGKHLDGSS